MIKTNLALGVVGSFVYSFFYTKGEPSALQYAVIITV